MVTTITESKFQSYRDDEWEISCTTSYYDGKTYTIEKQGDTFLCCLRTTGYALSAPIVLSVTTALAVPACLLTGLLSGAQATPRSETNLTEEQYNRTRRGLHDREIDSASCVDSICSLNGSLLQHCQPCESTLRLDIFVPSASSESDLLLP